MADLSVLLHMENMLAAVAPALRTQHVIGEAVAAVLVKHLDVCKIQQEAWGKRQTGHCVLLHGLYPAQPDLAADVQDIVEEIGREEGREEESVDVVDHSVEMAEDVE